MPPSPPAGQQGLAPFTAGPLGRVVEFRGSRLKGRSGFELGAGANATILMRRLAVTTGREFPEAARAALLHWAGAHDLGQPGPLVAEVAARRERAVAARVAAGRRRGQDVTHRRLLVRPMWRMVTGIGERTNPHEIGIALHGTYGWPVIPGSTLKGVTRAWARHVAALPDPQRPQDSAGGRPEMADQIDRIFGPEPAGGDHSAGSVDVLDALPAGEVVAVTVDGVTPHVQPYYGEAQKPATDQKTAPGEWHNPVPSAFLTVSGGRFAVDVIGPPEDCDRFAEWCQAACDELGVGAKTAAGYGYLLVDGAAPHEVAP